MGYLQMSGRKEFNTHMKEVVRDYKIRQAKARESAKKVIIK